MNFSSLTLYDWFEYSFWLLLIPVLLLRFKFFKYDIIKAEIIELVFDGIYLGGFLIFTIELFTLKKLFFCIVLVLGSVIKVYTIFSKLNKERLG